MLSWLRSYVSSVVSVVLLAFSCKKKTAVLPMHADCDAPPPRKMPRRTSASDLQAGNTGKTVYVALSTPNLGQTCMKNPKPVTFHCKSCQRLIHEEETIFCYGDSQFCGEMCRARNMYGMGVKAKAGFSLFGNS